MNIEVLKKVEALCDEAAQAALAIYRQKDGWQVTAKQDDSPVTAADLAAHKVLVAGLPEILNILVLSEESQLPDFAERQTWQRYWLVDPLDGTKEFISGNGEFTVNVALIADGQPVLGVVVVPVTGVVYSAVSGLGAYKNGEPIRCRQLPEGAHPIVVASRRHGSSEGDKALANLESHFGGVELMQVGSSLKFCMIAEGKADIYPRFAPTCEWDTAAAQAVLAAAGGEVVSVDGCVLGYNHKESLLNPFFVALGDTQVPWMDILTNCHPERSEGSRC
ncbi:3'(2'),5'-bisphosphate nucleotidase CysQ [Porticoccus sp. W117]|uniref:3'(2'),5'-bisphosphate nucleotidase CysQ n=1 Tax=Porticoccus sp. W117 TaxID=3054777 RepID=UPI002599DE76|nr:3'(2'),5'-bisphosphate nucleotidase CysQ [Porticoccus sp. W117]MDM3870925.1 3'(2'),5'-bisphosphate nucleotidase CysQ [Porticoccus sp. W117]